MPDPEVRCKACREKIPYRIVKPIGLCQDCYDRGIVWAARQAVQEYGSEAATTPRRKPGRPKGSKAQPSGEAESESPADTLSIPDDGAGKEDPARVG